jgi:hypothetical protein
MSMLPKVECPECHGLFDPRGLGPHMKKHGITASVTVTRAGWSDDQLNSIATEFVLLRMDQPLADAHELLQTAVNKALPPAEVRPVRMTSGLIDAVTKAWQTLNDNTVEVPIVVERQVPPPPFNYRVELSKIPFEDLLQVFGARMGAIIDHMGTSRAVIESYAKPKVVEPTRPRKPRVAIIGLLSDQQQAISASAEAGDFDLRFINKERANQSINSAVDWIVVQKHTAHGWWNSARDKIGADRVLFAAGGISSVLECLRNVKSRA